MFWNEYNNWGNKFIWIALTLPSNDIGRVFQNCMFDCNLDNSGGKFSLNKEEWNSLIWSPKYVNFSGEVL